MNLTPVGIDIAKSIFQLHYVDAETGEIVNRPIKRARFLEHFANRAPCLIGMEACGGAQHWARELIKMGHQVKLMPAEFAKAFNIRNKNDAADARAVWLAVQQPSKAVAIKTESQQAVLALHRMRQQLVKFRTMQINSLRGLLTEYGEVMGRGRAALDNAIPAVLARISDRLPMVLIDTLREQWDGLTKLDEQIAVIERRLRQWMLEDKAVKAITAIPGVGVLTATAAVATMGDAKSFRSGREFAAWVGLVPKQTGSFVAIGWSLSRYAKADCDDASNACLVWNPQILHVPPDALGDYQRALLVRILQDQAEFFPAVTGHYVCRPLGRRCYGSGNHT